MSKTPDDSRRRKRAKGTEDKNKSSRNRKTTRSKTQSKKGGAPTKRGCTAAGQRKRNRKQSQSQASKPAGPLSQQTRTQQTRNGDSKSRRRPGRKGWTGKPQGKAVAQKRAGQVPGAASMTPSLETIQQIVAPWKVGDISGLAEIPRRVALSEFIFQPNCRTPSELIREPELIPCSTLILPGRLALASQLVLPPGLVVSPVRRPSSLMPPVAFVNEFDQWELNVSGNHELGGVLEFRRKCSARVELCIKLRPLYYSLLEVMIDYAHVTHPATGRSKYGHVAPQTLQSEINSRCRNVFTRVYRLVHDFRKFVTRRVAPLMRQQLGIAVRPDLGDSLLALEKNRGGYRLAVRPEQVTCERLY